TVSTIQAGDEPRSQVRCYNLDQDNDGTIDRGVDSTTHIGARSLTIVRLDSGEVVRSFRKNVDEEPGLRDATSGEAGTNGLIALANLDSPITGTPAAYPSGTGAVADRIFVGDQDGALWRVNLSSPDPENWTMELFFDGYAKHPDFASPALAAAASHAVVLPPTLSVDLFGQVTVAFATGEQDLAGGATDENYVWSLRETVNDDASG